MSKIVTPQFSTYEEGVKFWDNLDTSEMMDDDGEWLQFETPFRRAVRVAI